MIGCSVGLFLSRGGRIYKDGEVSQCSNGRASDGCRILGRIFLPLHMLFSHAVVICMEHGPTPYGFVKKIFVVDKRKRIAVIGVGQPM